MANKKDTSQNQINTACQKVLPDKVCKVVTQVLKDGGFRISKKPDIVVKPKITVDFKERKVKSVGGTIIIRFGGGGKKKK